MMKRIKRIFSFLFPEKWEPKIVAGSWVRCNAAELEKFIGASEFDAQVLEWTKETGKHYYRVLTPSIKLLSDSSGNPIDWYIHEKNILYPLVHIPE